MGQVENLHSDFCTFSNMPFNRATFTKPSPSTMVNASWQGRSMTRPIDFSVSHWGCGINKLFFSPECAGVSFASSALGQG
jgi:hypothetical protein